MTGAEPSFISPLPRPETNISTSVGVCQCQGTTHPDAALISISDPPVIGSPLSTTDLVQAGRPGGVINLAVAVAAYIGLPASSARAAWTAGPDTRTTNSRLQAAKRMGFLLGIEVAGSITVASG